jgi:hypothetical protein
MHMKSNYKCWLSGNSTDTEDYVELKPKTPKVRRKTKGLRFEHKQSFDETGSFALDNDDLEDFSLIMSEIDIEGSKEIKHDDGHYTDVANPANETVNPNPNEIEAKEKNKKSVKMSEMKRKSGETKEVQSVQDLVQPSKDRIVNFSQIRRLHFHCE